MSGLVGIILARAGSNRLPGKNVRLLAARPLIMWTIEAALKASSITQVVVSSNCPNVLNIANQYDDLIVINRPADLCTPEAKSEAAITHAIDYVKASNNFILLQPTSPFRNEKHIDELCSIHDRTKHASIVSVFSPSEFLPEKHHAFSGVIYKNCAKKNTGAIGPNSTKTFSLNGAMYFTDVNNFRKNNMLYSKESLGYIMSEDDSVDIDTDSDLLCAIEKMEREVVHHV